MNTSRNRTESSLNTSIKITTIYGKAGTGKSTYLAKLINTCHKSSKDFIVLTSTHSSLNTIYSICKSTNQLIPRNNFKTIYSYFRIDYENNTLKGTIADLPEFIFIDEFSLINKLIFKLILNHIKYKIKSPTYEYNKLYLTIAGDVLQLNSIYNEKQFISFSKIRKYMKFDTIDSVNVLEHLHLSIFGMKTIMNSNIKRLMNNYRSASNVMEVLRNIYNKNVDYEYKFINNLGIVNKAINGYVFLSSKYSILQDIYDRIAKYWKSNGIKISCKDIDNSDNNNDNDNDDCDDVNDINNNYDKNDVNDINDNIDKNKYDYNDINNKHNKNSNKIITLDSSKLIEIEQKVNSNYGFKQLYLYEDMKIIATKTSKTKNTNNEPTYYNGEELVFTGEIECDMLKCINSNNDEVYITKECENNESYYPIMPANLLTIHKSQGKSLDKVCVCIDELFDMSMLYTAITRCRNDLIFYSKNINKVGELMKNAFVDDVNKLECVVNKMCEKRLSKT